MLPVAMLQRCSVAGEGWTVFSVEGVWADPDVAAVKLVIPGDLDACWWNSCL